MSIVRSVALVNLLLSLLLAPFSATAQEKSHVTSEQVNKAVQELEQLAQKKIQENAVPGLAIAIVFQDKARYAKGFGVRDVNTKAPVDARHGVSIGVGFQTDWFYGGCRVGG
jgi:CubicO group peptidase (beta-lactamase class C family)